MHLSAALVSLALGCVLTLEVEQASSLRIVVLEGEGAVNIIQQKTAVRPLVEVRDRNNLPVTGASVTFSIGGGGGSGAAFAGGVQTLTVTTNAAGQAAASGLNALSSGAFQIQVQAAYQGQIATAAISQTNFATAAAATQAGASAGGGTTTGATGGAAGGGGGISGTTLGIVGAAVAGGAVAATQVAGQGEKDVFDTYSGSLSGQLQFSSFFTPVGGGATSNCLRTMALSGTMSIELKNGGTPGKVNMTLNQTQVALTGPCDPLSPPPLSLVGVAVSGAPSALTFENIGQSNAGGTAGTTTVRFTGALSGTTITGTVSLDIVQTGATLSPNAGASGSTSFQVTLQK